MVTPFTIDIPEQTLEQIRRRVADFPWQDMTQDEGWDHGTNLDYMKELCAYWLESYDWRAQEKKMNAFDHFKAEVDGIEMHCILEKGSGENPMPLLISHGWPGSFVESLDIIEKLAHPERFGGRVEDAFDVIVPSLPGFGFSGRPPRPFGPRAMAGVLNSLVTDVLGYDSYYAHGADWGSAISSWLGYDHADHCRAIHINFPTMRHVDGPQTPEEEAWAKSCETLPRVVLQNGYRTQQATKPQTLSYAMMDSPVGVAAWIVEKFHAWSDIDGDNVESAHTKDGMLTNIMVYLVTKTFNTSTWIYYGRREEGGRILGTKERPRVEVPTAAAMFPAESFPWPPRSYAERLYNIQRWTAFPHGGHFASLEEPDVLINDIVAFARSFR
ncbi:epoxide hydrolase family protein [Desulfoluna spongiiphila]|uniref:epoxide hydrolase family protein n=1 Tax=Desulfoluna spongiiphila TaxID=419481 RepID=UPI00125AC475|nr:epoxide hydrolase [Desulfoluna spongiiphila]VVS92164.1 alpha/beta hydrolase fold [Desulfoluna spongiiphila]